MLSCSITLLIKLDTKHIAKRTLAVFCTKLNNIGQRVLWFDQCLNLPHLERMELFTWTCISSYTNRIFDKKNIFLCKIIKHTIEIRRITYLEMNVKFFILDVCIRF